MPPQVVALGSADNGVTVTPLPIDAATGALKTTGAGGSATVGNVTEGWGVLSAGVSLFDDGGSNPAIKNLANAALQISNSIDNTSLKVANLNLLLNVRGASAFTAGSTVDIWILPSLDGANYEDGGTAVTPQRSADASFVLRAVATAQVLILTGITIPPTKYKVLLKNNGGQAFTNTNAENTLTYYTNP